MPHPLTTATLSLLLSATLLPAQTQTQTPPIPALADIHSQPELEATIRSLDTALFAAYNACNLPAFSALLADDVEFYHDQGGLILGRAALTDSVRRNVCGHVTRQLTPGSLRVYPVKGLGAVEMGTHRFFENGSPTPSGEADFVHLWLWKDGACTSPASSPTTTTPSRTEARRLPFALRVAVLAMLSLLLTHRIN